MTTPPLPEEAVTAEQLARMFHEAYERLAPSHGYETRKASAVPWDQVPEPNRSLMIAVAGEVLEAAAPHLAAAERERCVKLAGEIRALLTSGPIGGQSGERYIRADLIRAVLAQYES